MEKILEKYRAWVGDSEEHDSSWEYDMIHDFFDGVLTRGELLEIIEFLKSKP